MYVYECHFYVLCRPLHRKVLTWVYSYQRKFQSPSMLQPCMQITSNTTEQWWSHYPKFDPNKGIMILVIQYSSYACGWLPDNPVKLNFDLPCGILLPSNLAPLPFRLYSSATKKKIQIKEDVWGCSDDTVKLIYFLTPSNFRHRHFLFDYFQSVTHTNGCLRLPFFSF